MSHETSTTSTVDDLAGLRRGRIAITAIFLVFGVAIGTWAAHIPIVQTRLALGPAMLGLALLGAAAGTIIAQPLLGALIARVGSRRPLMILAVLTIIALPLAVFAPSIVLFFLVQPFVGAVIGGLNVAMNTQANEIEVRRGRPTMSSFHAGASYGMLGGSALSGVLLSIGWTHGEAALAMAAGQLVVAILVMRWAIADPPQARGPVFVVPSRAVFGLGALAFLMFIIEGGMVDWSALFLATQKAAEPGLAAIGFALFTGAMAIGRTFGNEVVTRLGRWPTVCLGGSLVALGILLAIAAPNPWIAAACFALAGLGSANVVPILMSAAAQTPGLAPSVAIGAVATMLTAGFLVGPPLIGFIAEATSLTVGIAVLALAGFVVALAALPRLRTTAAT